MPDLTPPPEQPLPPQAKARIRADLVEATQAGSAGSGVQRWVVPAAAAVAVALVAGLTVWAVQLDGDADGSNGTPATQTSSTVGSETPSEEPTDEVTPDDGETVQVGTRDCVAEMEHVLKGADEAVAFDDGLTSYWVKGDRFVLCDIRAGRTTVHRALPMTPRDEVATYRVSTRLEPIPDGFRTTWVAGGVVPAGALAYDITYTFPYDGHVEPATTVTDDQGRTWWRMVYEYEGSGNTDFDSPGISVTVSLSGAQHEHELSWAEDKCAQANHGC